MSSSNHYLDNKLLENNIIEYKSLKKEKKYYELILEDLESRIKYNDLQKIPYNLKTIEYNNICTKFSKACENLALNFTTLAEHIIKYRKFNFVEYDDAMQEFIMICFDKIDRFDPEYVGKNGKKAKAFNFSTTIILNAYRQLYRSARNYNELKKKYSNSLLTNDKTKNKKKNSKYKYFEDKLF